MRIATMLALAVAALPTHGAGQALGLDVRAGRITDERGESRTGATLAPALVWGGESAAVALGGEAVLVGNGGAIGAAGLRVRVRSSGEGPGVTLLVDGSANGSSAGFRALGVGYSPRAGYSGRAWSIAAGPHLGVGARRPPEDGPGPDVWTILGSASARGYEGHTVHGVVAELGAGAGPLRASGVWRRSTAESARWRDVQAEVALVTERLALALEGGVRSGAVSEEWAGLRAIVQLAPGFALVTRAGRYAADPLSGRAAGTRAELGVRLRTTGSSDARRGVPVSLPALSDGPVRLVLRAEPRARVEIVGDWTGWQPVPVEESEPGIYAVAVHLPPGTHRFAFLVDGVWQTPEGYATEPDGYGGRRAMIRVVTR